MTTVLAASADAPTWVAAIGTWAAAAATLGAVLYAYSLQAKFFKAQEYLKTAGLILELDPSSTSDMMYLSAHELHRRIKYLPKEEQQRAIPDPGQEELWVRLGVRNGPTAGRATEVSLKAIRVLRIGAEQQEIMGRQFFKVSQEESVRATIESAFRQNFDLLYFKATARLSQPGCYLVLVGAENWSWVQERERIEAQQELEPGNRYLLSLALVSEQSRAQYYILDFELRNGMLGADRTGQSEDERRSALLALFQWNGLHAVSHEDVYDLSSWAASKIIRSAQTK